MAGPGGQVHRGWRRHMRWAREASWGQLPPLPAWISVPIQSGRMGLGTAADLFQPDTAFKGWKRNALLRERQVVTGRVEVAAWPEVTGLLLDAALERDSSPAAASYQDLFSYAIDFFTPPDGRRYLGVMVDRLQIGAAEGEVLLRLWLRAWKEEANASLQETDFSYANITPAPFRLRDAAITFAGGAVTDVEAFTIAVDNDLQPGPNAAGRDAFLTACSRTVSLELTKLHNSDALNDAIRDGGSLSFAATFTHPAGHQLMLQTPVLYAARNSEPADPMHAARSRALLEAVTDGAGNDLIYQLDLAGATTTTTPAS